MACICVAPAICVSLSGSSKRARVCVFQSYTTLPLPVKCLQMPWLCSEAMTVCHCMGVFEPARRMHACTHFARVTVQSALLLMS